MPTRTVPLEKLAVRLLCCMFLGLSALILVELAVDLSASGKPWSDLSLSALAGRSFASAASRAFTQLTGMILTFIALAVPITANMYTPRLIEIFVRDRVNFAVLTYIAGFGAHSLLAHSMMFDQWAPRLQYTVLAVSAVCGFLMLIPYYFYVLSFLNPSKIIRRVCDGIYREFGRISRGVQDVPEAQRRLDQELLNLGNVVLRAVDRADRDVSIDAVSSLCRVVARYGEVKPGLPPRWFVVEHDRFAGYTPDAIGIMERDRVWVEHRCLHQLLLAYSAALAKMPDAVSAISDVSRQLALSASSAGDEKLLALCVRYLNTFLREAVKRKDVHAIYDVSSRYSALARDLLATRPAVTLEIARHFKYYADFAKWQGMQFVYELAASDLGSVVEAAYEASAPTRAEILGVFLSFEGEKSTVRLTKSVAIVAAYFIGKGLTAELDRVRAVLRHASADQLAAARREIAATVDPCFWEVTDRQTNLDYVEPARRAAVEKVLSEVEAARREAPRAS